MSSTLTDKAQSLATLENIVTDDLDITRLSPFLRVLLTTDGTVTSSLEAYFWEPIAVEPTRQSLQALSRDVPHIERKKGDEVLVRQVQLRGLNTGTVYVEAESLICLDILPLNFQEDLNKQRLGIGELLRECGLETYREILEIGQDRQVEQVWRSYRIVMEHQPFIQITEHFPLKVFN